MHQGTPIGSVDYRPDQTLWLALMESQHLIENRRGRTVGFADLLWLFHKV